MKNFIRKNPNIAYFTLTFGWTWILVFGLIFSGGVKDISKPTASFVLVGLICNISPSIAAFIVTRVTKGKEGVKLLKDKFKIKGKPGLYALPIFLVPAVLVLTTIISHFTIRRYELTLEIPLLFMGLVWPWFSGFGEEFGWRGFILPQLLSKYSPLKAGLILGLIWSIWHIPMDYIAYKDFGVYLIPAFLVIDFINLTLQSVIMTYIFTKSNGNLRLMVFYHATITGSAIIAGAFLKAQPLPKYTVYEGILSVTIFFIIAVILYSKKEKIRGGSL